MGVPFFYIPSYSPSQQQVVLDEDTSRHVVQVLRMKTGERLNLADGKGHLLECSITDDHKKHCTVSIIKVGYTDPPPRETTIAISLLKNTSRFEWFLEKATEIGITRIIPVICERTEKEKFRNDRLTGILTSAMLQSQQSWLPILHEPISFELLFRQEELLNMKRRFVAHCESSGKKVLLTSQSPFTSSTIILIGPEGDFTPSEIDLAIQHHYVPVSLGNSRLRTETAGVVAATLIMNSE